MKRLLVLMCLAAILATFPACEPRPKTDVQEAPGRTTPPATQQDKEAPHTQPGMQPGARPETQPGQAPAPATVKPAQPPAPQGQPQPGMQPGAATPPPAGNQPMQ